MKVMKKSPHLEVVDPHLTVKKGKSEDTVSFQLTFMEPTPI